MRVSDYDLLYDLPSGEYSGKGIDGVRTATIRAGRSLEVMVYPITRLSPEARREAKARRTSAAMEKLNARNTQRHIMRLEEANFTGEAVVFTGTYAYPAEEYGMCNLQELSDTYERRGLPWDMGRVKRDQRNFLSRLRRRVVNCAGSADSFRWIIRIEEGKTPPAEGLPPKYHIHALIEGAGLTREAVEACWPHGFTTCERFDLANDGPARLARYLCKQRRGGRWWSHSRNLKNPAPRISDRKLSRRRLSRIAADVQREGRDILEAIYPGYRVVELPDVKYSDFVAGCYIYARMRRRD